MNGAPMANAGVDSNTHRVERLNFLRIGSGTRDALVAFRPVLEANVQKILGAFYDHIMRQPELAAKFAGQHVVDHARSAQAQHWLSIFEGRFDEADVERVRRIGKTHERIGLEPRWYIGGYALAMNQLVSLAIRHYRDQPEQLEACLHAINKALYFDMDMAISVYIEESHANFRNQLDRIAEDLERGVKDVVDAVSTAASDLRVSAQSMAATAGKTSQLSGAVAAAATEASANVQTVAAAAEELSASIVEIGRQVNHSADIAGKAMDAAKNADGTVTGLADAAQKIGAIVKLINDIAGRTNLLALNATIEAARAGSAGKGFAVVASEVKALANQTAKATDEIAGQIAAIQGATREAVAAIQGIGARIGEINEIATGIAAAIDEQGASTQEIARNVMEAATGTNDVSGNIANVQMAADSSGEAAGRVLGAADALSRHADSLRGQMGDFLQRIRSR